MKFTMACFQWTCLQQKNFYHSLVIFIASLCTLAGCSSSPKNSEQTSGPLAKVIQAVTPKSFRPQPPKENRLIVRGIDFSKAPNKIAFGSCLVSEQPQPIWKAVIEAQPDLFISAGDILYTRDVEPKQISEQYKKLTANPEYRTMREKIPFMATWDDGEYSVNDGGADIPKERQAEAKKAFLTHFPYVKDSMPLFREGIYHAKMIGGQVVGRRKKRIEGPAVQIIMLDTRTFRSPLKEHPDAATNPLLKYTANTDPKATILGEDQWDWLEEQLKKPVQFRVIVSSIQVLGSEHGFEKWANFPREREKLLRLISRSSTKNVILISGDRHLGIVSKEDLKGWGPLFEVTSSSLNRESQLVEKDKVYISQPYGKENFGLITLDWSKKKAKIELKDLVGQTLSGFEIPLRK